MIQDRPDFVTHFRYVERLESLSRGITLDCEATKPRVNASALRLAEGKRQLIALTQQSLEKERSIVDFDPEYSQAAVLWLPVKAYYLLYHVLSLIEFLRTGDPRALSFGHVKFIEKLTQELDQGRFKFSTPWFNTVFRRQILEFREKSGAHLSPYADDNLIFN